MLETLFERLAPPTLNRIPCRNDVRWKKKTICYVLVLVKKRFLELADLLFSLSYGVDCISM
jgi:hypothetical protein